MRKKRYLIILLILLLYLGMELFLPLVAENNVRKGIINQTDEVKGLEIKVSSFPAWELLKSRADRIKLTADRIVINNLVLRSISASYRNVKLNNGQIKGNNTDLNILISEEDLNNYINNKYEDLEDFRIKLNPEQVYLSGKVNFFETKFKIQLAGNFTISELNKITFVPADLQIEELKIPSSIIRNFVNQLGFSFDLGDLNIPIEVEEINIREGELLLLRGIFARKAGL